MLQFTQRITKKNLAEIGEPMVPDREITGCFRKYLPPDELREVFVNFSRKKERLD
jgi:hypothetical protein